MPTRIIFRFLLSFALLFGATFLFHNHTAAQTVTIGQGNYTTVLPDGGRNPQNSAGAEISPKVTDPFDKPIQTNDFWSSLIFPYNINPHSNNIYAHPITFKSISTGLQIGYTSTHILQVNNYEFPFSQQLQVGVTGLSATETLTEDYGDWTVTALWEDDSASMRATFGHGLPYAFFTVSGGNAEIDPSQSHELWHNENEVLGLTISGRHYGIFAPTGSEWTGTDVFESTLNGKNFFSIALLPDTTSATLELFRSHAYAFVTNSTVDWEYDESSSLVTTTYTYETVLMDSAVSNTDETLTALYRHQWLNTSDVLTSYTYESPRGEMKVLEGNTFTTEVMFSGTLPSLPDLGSYDRIQLLEYVQDAATETLTGGKGTYESGVEMGKFAQLVHIADQLGAVGEKDHFISELKLRLEDWFTVGGTQEYYYNSSWNSLTGFPSGFGADNQLNDQHFHAGYAIMAAATIAQYDSAWASQDNWGGMVNLLIRNASNWDRTDEMFPFLRNHDTYAGHSWASGHADFANGNNQESSSESMNYASALILWGEMTGQEEIRDLGIFLYTTETEAVEQYWFDVDGEVFPDDYTKNALGRVWGNEGGHDTWFGERPEFIHGINILPITASSFYLGREPDYVLANYNSMVTDLGGQPTTWQDVMWSFLALSDPDLAISYYEADNDYEPFDGESRAHTLHWLFNLKEMGHFNTEVYADIPTYGVFVNDSDDTTYVAYNAGASERLITFTDGFSFNVDAGAMGTYSTAMVADSLSPAPIPTIDPENVISIFSDTYPSSTAADFNVDEGQTTVTTIVPSSGNNMLRYDILDLQTTELDIPQNVSSRDTLHVHYWTSSSNELSLFLVSESGEEKYDFSIVYDEWQSVRIPLTTFSGVDLFAVTELRFEGHGTVLVDDIFFYADSPVPAGPQAAAPTPILEPENVISIFSEAYTNIPGTNFNPDWQQLTTTSILEIAGDSTLKYENLNYQGTEFGESVDASEMEWFHLDYWTEDSSELLIYLISPGPQETPYEISIKNGSWQSVDIPLSEYSEIVDLSEVFQIKIEGNGTVFFDNLYFGRNTAVTSAPTPTHDANKVISLFSNAYDNVPVDTWSAGWDQANLEDIVIDGDDVKYYSNLTFAGIEFIAETIDGTNLTNLRFDMWTSDVVTPGSEFSVKLVDFGANGVWSGGDDVEDELFYGDDSTPQLVSNQWISFDIPIDDFVNMTTREHLAQLLFIGNSEINEIYIDNVYFYSDQVINNTEGLENDIPDVLELSQNYPNPFNPSTNIEFGIPQSSQVTLEIFNTLGQLVSTLIDSRLTPGTYSVPWDASQYTSGVYFYRLSAGDEVLTKKMLLIK